MCDITDSKAEALSTIRNANTFSDCNLNHPSQTGEILADFNKGKADTLERLQ